MTKKDIEIDSQLNGLELLTRKAKVIADDLIQGYFGENVESISDAWKLLGPNYEAAGLRAGIVNDFLYELIDELLELRAYLNQKEGECPGGKD